MSHAVAGAPALAPDAWLGAALGVPAFAVRPAAAEPARLQSALADAAAGADAFFFCKLPAADAAALQRCLEAGFRLIDRQITLERRAGASGAAAEIGPARPDERAALLDIAGGCFRHSRFHQDPRIGTEAANRVKRLWLENCLGGRRGEEVLVAREGGRPAGFLAVLLAAAAEGPPVAVIDLIGVAAERQGRGHGAALVRAFIARWGPRAARLRVGTQAGNAVSLRLYERCGFTFADAAHVLHAHFRAGRPA